MYTTGSRVLYFNTGIKAVDRCSTALCGARIPTDFDTCQLTSYFLYHDINNMHGEAMITYLPYGGEDLSLDVSQVSDNAVVGYMLEVDLEYPQELHDCHKNLPFGQKTGSTWI